LKAEILSKEKTGLTEALNLLQEIHPSVKTCGSAQVEMRFYKAYAKTALKMGTMINTIDES